MVGVVVLACASATALGKRSHHPLRAAQLKAADVTAVAPGGRVLVPGVGYGDVDGSASVRALQRRLAAAGYAPGPLDGRYGSRTEAAVIRFQSTYGLRVDGIAGPRTLAALRAPVAALYVGAGYGDVHGSVSVRALQRRLAAAGYAPGPVDGRYGPRTEAAVIRFQSTHGLRKDGIAGAQTLDALVSASPRTSGTAARIELRPKAAGRTPARPKGASSGRHIRTARRAHVPPALATTLVPRAPGHARRGGRSHLPLGWIVLIAVLGIGALLALIAQIPRRRRGRPRPAAPASPRPPRSIDVQLKPPRSGDAQGAFNVGVLLAEHGDLEGAEAAYRQADQLGNAAAACNLGVLLEQRGDRDAAEAAYRRAAAAGDSNGVFNLVAMLSDRGGDRRILQRRSTRPRVCSLQPRRPAR